MSSQYLSTDITVIHGKQSTGRQTAFPPYSPTILVCQTKCNVFLPPKIIPAAYMESPRMGPNLPYKPATPNRKTSHTRISQSRKTSHPRISQNRKTSHPSVPQSGKTNHPRISQSHKTSLPRTTRSSLFPLIIIHVRRYGESSRGPYHPWGRACDRVCVSGCLGRRGAPIWEDMQEDRETGRTARHTEHGGQQAGSS